MGERKIERQTCEHCGGAGAVQMGMRYVSRDMAIDAGDPSLEGQPYGIESWPCNECNGDGWVLVDVEDG